MSNPTQEVTNAQLRADIHHLSTQLSDLDAHLKTHTAHTLANFEKHNQKLETLTIHLAQLQPQVEENTNFITTLTWRLLGAAFASIGLAISLLKLLSL